MELSMQVVVIAVVAFGLGALTMKLLQYYWTAADEERPTVRIRNGSIRVETEATDGDFEDKGPQGWVVKGRGKRNPTRLTVVANGERHSTENGPHQVTITFKKVEDDNPKIPKDPEQPGDTDISSVSIELRSQQAYVILSGASKNKKGNKKTLTKALPGKWEMATVTVGNGNAIPIDCGSSAVVDVEQTP